MAVNKKVEDLKTTVATSLATVSKLEGPQGLQGAVGATGKQGAKGDQGIQGIVGPRGIQGVSGASGKDGLDGKDGVSVVDAQVDLDGRLTITLSDGSELDAGEIKLDGTKGPTFHQSGGLSKSDVLKLIEANVNMTYNTLIDTVGSHKYIGESLPGSATSAALWRIKRIDQTDTGGDVNILWANGLVTFNQVWDDRLSLTYTATGA